ncbi:MAG: response regulator [Oleiphilaceae bacterium]|nr:response regulator [Oleiphilaceae bacterium]
MATILAVDDSVSIRQMVSLTLSSAGYEVVEAYDGIDALRKAAEHHIDLVLSDVNMPNMDGIQLVKALREKEDYQYVPILMLTTESGKDMKMAGKQAGATGWLVKPFNPEKLLATIRRVLD